MRARTCRPSSSFLVRSFGLSGSRWPSFHWPSPRLRLTGGVVGGKAGPPGRGSAPRGAGRGGRGGGGGPGPWGGGGPNPARRAGPPGGGGGQGGASGSRLGPRRRGPDGRGGGVGTEPCREVRLNADRERCSPGAGRRGGGPRDAG